MGNILVGTVCSRRNITAIEGLSLGRTEKVVAVFCLGGYCPAILRARRLWLVAMEFSVSALSEFTLILSIVMLLSAMIGRVITAPYVISCDHDRSDIRCISIFLFSAEYFGLVTSQKFHSS